MNKQNMASTIACVLLLAVVAILFAAQIADAAPQAPASLTQAGSSSRDLSTLANQTVDARGGNVTELNIQALVRTQSWQGYYGNVTGQIILDDGNAQRFYNWTQNNFSGRIFASRSSSIAWTQINCTNATNRTNEETYLGQVASDADSVTNTYNSTTHPTFNVTSQVIVADTCFSTRGYVNNNSQGSNYVMLMLSPTSGVVVYTALTNKSATGFDGKLHDFELLVAENEKAGSVGTTSYYFWTDLS